MSYFMKGGVGKKGCIIPLYFKHRNEKKTLFFHLLQPITLPVLRLGRGGLCFPLLTFLIKWCRLRESGRHPYSPA